MHKFQDLKLWQKSMEIAEEVYKITKNFPEEEKFNLISQMRRCSVSIPSNIAEGAGRNSNKEFLHFLSISNGSTSELLTQVLLSKRLGFLLNEKALVEKINEIQKMNYVLRKRLINS